NNYLASLYNINTGSSAGGLYLRVDGNGNLLDLNANGTDVFTVTPAQLTSNIPAQFTAAGDVAISYDLNFTNGTSSYIKSLAPLYLQSGESFNSSDLTLRTFNSGNVIIDSQALVANQSASVSGQLAVGTLNPDSGN